MQNIIRKLNIYDRMKNSNILFGDVSMEKDKKKNSRDSFNIKKAVPTVLFFVPLVVGFFGYLKAFGYKDYLHAFYCSISLYVLNLGSDATNGLIHFARFSAALATSAVVLNRFSTIMKHLFALLVPLSTLDVTAVYTDSDKYDYLDKEKGCILSKDKIFLHCSNQILMFKDFDNLDFYEQNRHDFELKNRITYMQIEEIDPYMLRDSSIRYFSINETIAREFWRKYDLCEYIDKKTGEVSASIAIIGFSSLGKHILRQGILNNLYSVNQKIEYHIYGDDGLFESQHEDWNSVLMNGDSCYFEKDEQIDLCKLKDIDRVIITDETKLELCQMIMSVYPEKEVFFYSSKSRNLEERLLGNLHEFGNNEDFVTLDNITSGAMYKAAYELNEDYNKKHPQYAKSWEKLSGFTKGSNITSVDYHLIRCKINSVRKELGLSEFREEITGDAPRLEHIRWCRYHFLNNWKYADIKENKDSAKKLHKYLRPYDELEENIQQNDVDTILQLNEVIGK